MRPPLNPSGRVDWPECIGGPLDGEHYSCAWPEFVVTKRGSRILVHGDRLTREADSELAGIYSLADQAVPWHFDWRRFQPDELSQADGVR